MVHNVHFKLASSISGQIKRELILIIVTWTAFVGSYRSFIEFKPKSKTKWKFNTKEIPTILCERDRPVTLLVASLAEIELKHTTLATRGFPLLSGMIRNYISQVNLHLPILCNESVRKEYWTTFTRYIILQVIAAMCNSGFCCSAVLW